MTFGKLDQKSSFGESLDRMLSDPQPGHHPDCECEECLDTAPLFLRHRREVREALWRRWTEKAAGSPQDQRSDQEQGGGSHDRS